MLFFVVIPAGHRARTSYKCDIKILNLQIEPTGYDAIQNNSKRPRRIERRFCPNRFERKKDEIAEDDGANTDYSGEGSNFDTCINVDTKTNYEA